MGLEKGSGVGAGISPKTGAGRLADEVGATGGV